MFIQFGVYGKSQKDASIEYVTNEKLRSHFDV
jgi:hypothetical protein